MNGLLSLGAWTGLVEANATLVSIVVAALVVAAAVYVWVRWKAARRSGT